MELGIGGEYGKEMVVCGVKELDGMGKGRIVGVVVDC